ncbi:MAG: right-handed parallel beta-helix repeat-containing protein, partial [Pseudooceanicola sp.]
MHKTISRAARPLSFILARRAPWAGQAVASRRSGVRALMGLTLVSLLLIALGVSGARARDVHVSDSAGLMAALAAAKGGERILLKGGNYAHFKLTPASRFNFAYPSEVTIASADPGNPAVITYLDVRSAKNLTFDGITFDYTYAKGHKTWFRVFKFDHSDNITIRNSVFDGDVAKGVSEGEDGRGWAVGLDFRGGRNIVVEKCVFNEFYKGLIMGGVVRGVVRGNDFYDLRMDGMNFVGMNELLIEGNRLRRFRRAVGAGDHADMIQFWTANSTRPTTDVVIRNNLLMTGDGHPTHSIFMRNEAVDKGKAGIEMFYRNIAIENNLIVNGHVHGITVGETNGLRIRNNTLIRAPAFAKGGARNQKIRIPRISTKGTSTGVTITGNLAASYPKARDGWVVRGNMPIQDISVMKPGYYGRVFENPFKGNPANPASFRYKPDAVPAGVGSTYLWAR